MGGSYTLVAGTYMVWTTSSGRNQLTYAGLKGFPCHAGHSGFWMNWKGELMPYGMFPEPAISLLEHSFEECWKYIVEMCDRMPQCEACKSCKKQNICQVCPAGCYTESGSTGECPDYICQMTDAMMHDMNAIICQKENQ